MDYKHAPVMSVVRIFIIKKNLLPSLLYNINKERKRLFVKFTNIFVFFDIITELLYNKCVISLVYMPNTIPIEMKKTRYLTLPKVPVGIIHRLLMPEGQP